MKNFFVKNWVHFAVVASFFVITYAYLSPEFKGYGVKQHDIEQFSGMANEIVHYREKYGEEPLWTNSMFGGMPATQISVKMEGNIFQKSITGIYRFFGQASAILFFHLLGFYLLSQFLKLKPLVGFVGATAFAFASYEIIIIQAGHSSKAMAIALIAPVIGAFIYTFRTNWKWGAIYSSIFMGLHLAANHLQVSYYFAFLMGGLGIYFLIEAFQKKQFKTYLFSAGAVLVGYLLAIFANYGNIAMTNDYAKETMRGGNQISIAPDGTEKKASKGLDKDYITNWSYGIGESFTFISPYVKGSGSVMLAQSDFSEMVENSDLDPKQIKEAMEARFGLYWGDQPMTSGPVYLGVIVVFLALLGLVYIKDRSKWVYLAVSILAVMLSWGKNYMGLTNFFIDHIPGYDKFRTVTIILVVVELCLPLLMVLLLNKLIVDRAEIQANKKPFLITSGAFFVFLLLVKSMGLGDGYATKDERSRMSNVKTEIAEQIYNTDPQELEKYGIDINNQAQMNQVIESQEKSTLDQFESMKAARKVIFEKSMNRSLLFTFFAIAFLALIFYTSISSVYVVAGIGLLILIDLIPVDLNYLNARTDDNGEYKLWVPQEEKSYPFSPISADYEILEKEIANPEVAQRVAEGEKEGRQKADELEYAGAFRARVIEAYRFSALNFATNYRVMEYDGLWSSTRASYFHKSIGGYHGAKLSSIQNLFDFHIARSNNKVLDMLNVKYMIQGGRVNQNFAACGNAWLVEKVITVPTVNEEIQSLGKTLEIENKGPGQFLVNGSAVNKKKVYGNEKLQYFIPGKDTMNVPMSNGFRVGMEVLFVMDANGKTNLIPKMTNDSDTANSFNTLVTIKLLSDFEPAKEVVILDSIADKIGKKSFTAKGSIRMKSYLPNKITYAAECSDTQLAVFSEIYYPNGWKAYIDGKETEILKANYLLRSIVIPKGKHSIEFVFDLPVYHKATSWAVVSTSLLLGAILFLVIINRKRKAE